MIDTSRYLIIQISETAKLIFIVSFVTENLRDATLDVFRRGTGTSPETPLNQVKLERAQGGCLGTKSR